MAGRDPPARWSPREDLPGQTDLVDWLATAPPVEHPPPPTVDGGPPLVEVSYDALARIGRAVHGSLWEGKLAMHVVQDPRTIRRWRDGQGGPSPYTMLRARLWGLGVAADVLAAAGEPDLAKAVRRRLAAIKAEARQPPPVVPSQKGAGG